jgi:hypothetical protein
MSFNYVELIKKDVYLSLLGRLFGALLIALPYFWYYVLGAPGGGNKIFAVIAALVLTVAEAISLLIIMRTLHRLLAFYTPNVKGIIKLGLTFICLYLPIFEIKYFVSNKGDDIVVPAFVQPRIGNSNSVFVSLMCFMDGLPLMNSNKLANALKDEGYFCVADNDYDPAVTINTNIGLFMCLIKPTSLYVFKELDFGEKYNIPQDSKWRLEHSQDQTTSAIVYEQDFDPFLENEKTLALDIGKALTELKTYHRTN